MLIYLHNTSNECPDKPGGSLRGGRENLPVECPQGRQLVRCPNQICCVHQPLDVLPAGVSLGGDVLVAASFVAVVVICCAVM